MNHFIQRVVLVLALVACVAVAKDEDGKKLECPVVGIDLGTTYSVVGVWKNGEVQIIPNEMGNRITPSVVAFTDSERLIGDGAKNQLPQNPENTVYTIKRLIGRKYSDKTVQYDKTLLSFQIVADKEGQPRVQVNYKGEKKTFTPEEISAMILQKMKEIAENYLGETVKNAVVTVPAYFNDAQRQSTKDAGVIAGLNVARIINEPTAAAIAYGMDKEKDRVVAIYDLGGGTFDISILEIAGGVFEVKATNGDTFLGGEDFDATLTEHILNDFKKTTGIDLAKDRMALQRVREAAEKAKCELSSAAQTEINLPFISANAEGPQHIQMSLTRAKFEGLVDSLVQRTIPPVKMCLKDAGLDVNQVQEVVMVGGMTRMPKVVEVVKQYFGREPFKGVNPDEVVAIGAAVQGGVMRGEVKGLVLLDVTPLSLGIETLGGVFTRMINKNTTIPTKKSQVYSTAADNQTQVGIKVFQGEREMAADNQLLGQFDLVGIPPAPRGVPQIEVTFDIDANGICHVNAKDKATGREQAITIQANGGLSSAEVQQMIKDSEMHAEADRVKRELVEVKNQAETQLNTAERQLGEWKHVSDAEKENVRKLVSELRSTMDNSNASKDELQGATDKLQKAVMECGRTEYQQAAAANNSGSNSQQQQQQQGEQQQQQSQEGQQQQNQQEPPKQ
eukprot:PhM_4_TR10470/c1_g3_i4/m.69423/K04043/dnaK, HSPA9; molecular chaperone DnaK